MNITITFKADLGDYEQVKTFQVIADTPEEASEAITVLITAMYAEMGERVEVSSPQSVQNIVCEPDRIKGRLADRTLIQE